MSHPTNEELLRMSLAGELPAELLELAADSAENLDPDQAHRIEHRPVSKGTRRIGDPVIVLVDVRIERDDALLEFASWREGFP